MSFQREIDKRLRRTERILDTLKTNERGGVTGGAVPAPNAQYEHIEADAVPSWQSVPDLTMADDTYIGLPGPGGRLGFDLTPNPDQLKIIDADLNFVTAAHGIIHVGGVSAGPPRQLLIADGTRYVPSTLAADDLPVHTHGGALDGGSLVVGTTDTDATPGSVFFAGVGGVIQEDNANFFWHDANDSLGLGNAVPGARLHVSAATATDIAGIFQTTDNNAAKNLTEWQVASGGIKALMTSDGSMALGLGLIGAGRSLDIQHTYTDLVGTFETQLITTLVNPVANSTGVFYGLRINISSLGATSRRTISGLTGNATHSGTGTISNVQGLVYGARNLSTGTANFARALSVNILNNNIGGTIGESTGVFVATPGNNGTINRNFGLFIANQNTATIDYSIYTNAGDVVFNAGNAANTVLVGGTTDLLSTVGITTTDTTDIGLVIRGTASQSASLQEWQSNVPAILLSVEPDGDLNFSTGIGIIHADGIAAGMVLRADGTRYVPATLAIADISDLAYAAPGLTFTTVNAAGAADTVMRTDASLAIFDATNPTSIDAGDTAAVGVAAFAGRRDHRHAVTSTADGETNVSTLLQSDANGRLRVANLGVSNPASAAAGISVNTVGLTVAIDAAETTGLGIRATTTTGISVQGSNTGGIAGNFLTNTGTGLQVNLTGAGAAIADFQDNGTPVLTIQDGGFADFLEYLRHLGDPDTFWRLQTDQASLDCGGVTTIDALSTYVNFGVNVGIGAVPAVNLDVAASTPVARLTDTRTLSAPSWDGTTISDLDFYTSDGSGGGMGVIGRIRSIGATASGNDPFGELAFWTGPTSAFAERVRVTYDGRVGINETDPLAQLHVDQAIDDAAIPVLSLDQADISEEMINFIVAATGAGNPVDTATAVGTVYARLRIAVNGTFKYIQLYNA